MNNNEFEQPIQDTEHTITNKLHIFIIKNTTKEEISHTIRNMKNTSSIGFDDIPISVIKNNTTHLKNQYQA